MQPLRHADRPAGVATQGVAVGVRRRAHAQRGRAGSGWQVLLMLALGCGLLPGCPNSTG
jgi:hypothetical protein